LFVMGDDQAETHFRSLCRTCQVQTMHRVWCRKDVRAQARDDEAGAEYDLRRFFAILQCDGCQDFTFAESEVLTKTDRATRRKSIETNTSRLWPPRLDGVREMPGEDDLPGGISRILQETREAMASNLPTLAAMGFRAVIEGVANNKRIPRGWNLEKKIDGLAAKGFLATAQAKMLHTVRMFGNAAAHELKPGTADELLAVLRIIGHLLETVYIVPALKAPVRRKRKKKPGVKPPT
jgi:hypothetical protein